MVSVAAWDVSSEMVLTSLPLRKYFYAKIFIDVVGDACVKIDIAVADVDVRGVVAVAGDIICLMSLEFFAIFCGTVITTRLFLYFCRLSSPTVGTFRLHHYMYGLVGIPFAFLAHSLALYALSAALVVDEITYLVIGGETHDDNYSALSLGGTLLLVVFVFIFREQLVGLFALFSHMVAH